MTEVISCYRISSKDWLEAISIFLDLSNAGISFVDIEPSANIEIVALTSEDSKIIESILLESGVIFEKIDEEKFILWGKEEEDGEFEYQIDNFGYTDWIRHVDGKLADGSWPMLNNRTGEMAYC